MKRPDRHAARIKSALAHNVKLLRERHGWTQEELAVKVGMHRVTINRIETGTTHPMYCEACLLADVLGVSVSQLRIEIWDGW